MKTLSKDISTVSPQLRTRHISPAAAGARRASCARTRSRSTSRGLASAAIDVSDGFAQDLGHGEAGVFYSMLLAANAAGALTGGIVLESFGLLQARARTAFILVIVWCLCISGFAASQIYALSVILMFVAGFVNLAFSSMSQTLVQLNAPDRSRGRIKIGRAHV